MKPTTATVGHLASKWPNPQTTSAALALLTGAVTILESRRLRRCLRLCAAADPTAVAEPTRTMPTGRANDFTNNVMEQPLPQFLRRRNPSVSACAESAGDGKSEIGHDRLISLKRRTRWASAPAHRTWVSLALPESTATPVTGLSEAWMFTQAGLLDGREARTHRVAQRLIVISAGSVTELDVGSSGSSWEDLALTLAASHAKPHLLLARTNHNDGVVRDLQIWLQAHYGTPSRVEAMMRRSGLPRTSFKQRFKRATAYAPLEHVHRVRVEEPKRRLERSDDPIDEICWLIGYEEALFLRRLFGCLTRLSPADYRRRVRRDVSGRTLALGGVGRGASS